MPMPVEPVALDGQAWTDTACCSCMHQSQQAWESEQLELALPVCDGMGIQRLQLRGLRTN